MIQCKFDSVKFLWLSAPSGQTQNNYIKTKHKLKLTRLKHYIYKSELKKHLVYILFNWFNMRLLHSNLQSRMNNGFGEARFSRDKEAPG